MSFTHDAPPAGSRLLPEELDNGPGDEPENEPVSAAHSPDSAVITKDVRLRAKCSENPTRHFHTKRNGEKTVTATWTSYQVVLENPGISIAEYLAKGGKNRELQREYNNGTIELTMPDGRTFSREPPEHIPAFRQPRMRDPSARGPGRPRGALRAVLDQFADVPVTPELIERVKQTVLEFSKGGSGGNGANAQDADEPESEFPDPADNAFISGRTQDRQATSR